MSLVAWLLFLEEWYALKSRSVLCFGRAEDAVLCLQCSSSWQATTHTPLNPTHCIVCSGHKVSISLSLCWSLVDCCASQPLARVTPTFRGIRDPEPSLSLILQWNGVPITVGAFYNNILTSGHQESFCCTCFSNSSCVYYNQLEICITEKIPRWRNAMKVNTDKIPKVERDMVCEIYI